MAGKFFQDGSDGANFQGCEAIFDGSYAVGEAHAGATQSASASIMTKGEISLAITGTGRGVDIGVTLGAFTIKKP